MKINNEKEPWFTSVIKESFKFLPTHLKVQDINHLNSRYVLLKKEKLRQCQTAIFLWGCRNTGITALSYNLVCSFTSYPWSILLAHHEKWVCWLSSWYFWHNTHYSGSKYMYFRFICTTFETNMSAHTQTGSSSVP